MIRAQQFVAAVGRYGYEVYSSVPCSFLTPFINYVIGDPALTYVAAANEGDAVATAAGAFIGGRPAIAMMQNSGLGNAVSPLTSLTYTFRLPLLLICTHRGAPGVSDEPQHELMGRVTGALFDVIGVPWEAFPANGDDIDAALGRAVAYIKTDGRPFAFVMPKGAVEAYALAPQRTQPRARCRQIEGAGHRRRAGARLPRRQVLEQVVELTSPGDTVVIATTGFTGRELYAAADRPNHFYMVGSMGCAPSLGLGLAVARPDLKIVVVDGDGAALMRMGNIATVGLYAGGNFTHVLLDNEAHDSTGAQATVASTVDFAAIAAACGYTRVVRGDGIDDLGLAFAAGGSTGPCFVHLKIATGTMPDLPRPDIAPHEALRRLMGHIGTL